MPYSKLVYLGLLMLLETSCRPAEPFSAGHFLRIKSEPTYRIPAGRTQHISLVFELQAGIHILAESGSAQQYEKVDFNLPDYPGIRLQSVNWSKPENFQIAESASTIQVYKKELLLQLALEIGPDTDKTIHRLQGLLFYQACDQQKCYFPKEFPFIIYIKVK